MTEPTENDIMSLKWLRRREIDPNKDVTRTLVCDECGKFFHIPVKDLFWRGSTQLSKGWTAKPLNPDVLGGYCFTICPECSEKGKKDDSV